MSRGPGKWQRMILAELASREWFWLRTLLPRRCTKAEYNALLRAAFGLDDAGLIVVYRYWFGATAGVGKTAVGRIGIGIPERAAVESVAVSVGEVPTWNLTNT